MGLELKIDGDPIDAPVAEEVGEGSGLNHRTLLLPDISLRLRAALHHT